MVSVRKQEFLEFFVVGFLFLLVGIFGYILSSFHLDLMVVVIAILYTAVVFYYRKKKKQKDDEVSLSNKSQAGYVTFILALACLCLILVLLVLAKSFMALTIEFDYRAICIFLGFFMIVYYLVFIRLETAGE